MYNVIAFVFADRDSALQVEQGVEGVRQAGGVQS